MKNPRPLAVRLALLAALALAAGSVQAAYQKVSNSGALLPATATLGSGPNDWACTYDDATHLLWEVKTADGGLRDQGQFYTNYDDPSQPQVWNGDSPPTFHHPTQAEITAASNSIGFQNAVNAQGLCGFTDWRRPTGDWSTNTPAGRELQSLYDPNTGDYQDIGYFRNSSAPEFWSGSTLGHAPSRAWVVVRNDANGWGYSRYHTLAVRLVRAGQLSELLIQTFGTGAGLVTDAAAAVNCARSASGATSGVCASTAPRTLTATPAAGSSFGGWSGCDSVEGSVCTVNAGAAKTVTASFNLGAGSVAAVPSLSAWALAVLALLLPAAAWRAPRRQLQKE